MKRQLQEALRESTLLFDGAIGTELQHMGLPADVCGELWNLERPDKVRSVHDAYLAAGAELITTNTFRANRLALSHYGLADRTRQINKTAVHIAREAAGSKAWVVGSMGPFGGFLEPLGETAANDAFSAFVEQAEALLAGGVDAIVIETMTAIEEMELALRAVRKAGAAFVIATMSFDKIVNGYKTMMGVAPQEAVASMRDGADVIGCNCGAHLEIQDYAEIVREIRRYSNLPIVVQPNAGQPALLNGEVVYSQAPDVMANAIEDLIEAGASIVGGCCGTTPAHIRAFASKLAHHKQG